MLSNLHILSVSQIQKVCQHLHKLGINCVATCMFKYKPVGCSTHRGTNAHRDYPSTNLFALSLFCLEVKKGEQPRTKRDSGVDFGMCIHIYTGFNNNLTNKYTLFLIASSSK